ncbi:hypothetical protein I4U23_015521 [Adineta vaga]|nr:hypothetical protein I4U23_015521 [Adineta vaga]
MAGVAKLFNGHIYNKLNEEVDLDAKDLKSKIIGLYFSAHWCPPCRNFTPKLVAFYQQYAQAKNFEIIFLSSDSDEQSFYNYYHEMPWLRLDYREREKKQELEYKYGVNGIPMLVLLDGKSGNIISTDARQQLEFQDPHGENFPWGDVENRCLNTSDTKCFTQQFPTHFEDLSHEIIYEIFEYLDTFDIYDAFFNLNIRFRKLFTHSNLPIKLQISSISKSDLEYYSANIILVYLHRITSLYITNSLSYDLNISPLNILTKYNRLETLILEQFPKEYLDKLFQDLTSLSNLSTLIILCSERIRNTNQYLLQIFRLPVLKYCKIFLASFNDAIILPFAIDEHSSIEHLVIEHGILFRNIDRLLSYFPQLRRLSLKHSFQEKEFILNQSIVLPHVTHLFLDLGQFSFDNFVYLIKNFFPKIEVLHLYAYGEEEYLNPNRWEELILSSMPSLRIFDINISSSIPSSSILLLDQFKSSFWVDRRWSFSHHGLRFGNRYSAKFYSINPYRSKTYQFGWLTNYFIEPTYANTNLNSVRHVCFYGQQSIYKSKHKFFNAKELILDRITSKNIKSHIIALQQVISLENLTKLDITSYEYSFKQLIEFLSFTHNLLTLKIRRIYQLDETDFVTLPNNELFQFVSNINTIQNLTITNLTEVKEVKLLFLLCPRIRYFIIHQRQRHATAIVRFLSSKFNDIARHLILLSICIDNGRYLESLKQLVQTKDCLQNCFLKVQNHQVYLWR